MNSAPKEMPRACNLFTCPLAGAPAMNHAGKVHVDRARLEAGAVVACYLCAPYIDEPANGAAQQVAPAQQTRAGWIRPSRRLIIAAVGLATTSAALLMTLRMSRERVLPLHEVLARRAYLAARDTIFATRGTFTGFGTHVPFTNRALRYLADATDTVAIIAPDTAAIGRPVIVHVKVHNGALFGVELGTVLTVIDQSLSNPTTRER